MSTRREQNSAPPPGELGNQNAPHAVCECRTFMTGELDKLERRRRFLRESTAIQGKEEVGGTFGGASAPGCPHMTALSCRTVRSASFNVASRRQCSCCGHDHHPSIYGRRNRRDRDRVRAHRRIDCHRDRHRRDQTRHEPEQQVHENRLYGALGRRAQTGDFGSRPRLDRSFEPLVAGAPGYRLGRGNAGRSGRSGSIV